MLDLIDFYERIVKEQCGVIAFQEKMMARTATTLWSRMADDEAHLLCAEETTREAIEDEVDEVIREGHPAMKQRLSMF